ncbi:unnamed protein product, partial [Coregonus sp. 'balchen']
ATNGDAGGAAGVYLVQWAARVHRRQRRPPALQTIPVQSTCPQLPGLCSQPMGFSCHHGGGSRGHCSSYCHTDECVLSTVELDTAWTTQWKDFTVSP